MPIEQSVKSQRFLSQSVRTAFDKSQRDFLSSFMHDQKVHSFKIASALFPPITSVSTFDKTFLTFFSLL